MDYSMYVCPKCNRKFKVKGTGKKIKCTKCKDVYLVSKTFSFLHLADLHLGRYLCDMDLIDDQRYILSRIIKMIEDREVDAVVVAGDVYDRAVPSEAAVRLMDDFLNKLVELKVKTFIIGGNHDSEERIGYGSALFKSSKVFISSRYEGRLYKQTVTDCYGDVDIYLLPYVKASQVKTFYPDDDITTYEDAVRVILEHANIDKTRRNILVAHQFVVGHTSDPALAGSESVATHMVGTVEKIGCDLFDDFDYVALGHIHSPQRVNRDEIRYAGSPLKYSISEVNNVKSVPLVTMGEKGDTHIDLIPLEPLRDLRHIKGPMLQLLKRESIISPKDYIYVTLTDEEVQNDAMNIFRQFYPYTLKLDYDNSHTRSIEQSDFDVSIKNKSFDELVSEFYGMMYGCNISSGELRVIKEVAKEAGVLNEAG